MPFADLLLSLVMNPAEASAVVGDLAEESKDHGALWYWSHLFGHLIRALGTLALAPGAGLGRLGCQSIAVWVAVMFGLASLVPVFQFLDMRVLGRDLLLFTNVDTPLLHSLLRPLCLPLTAVWVAWRARGGEIPAAMVSGAILWAFLQSVGSIAQAFGTHLDSYDMPSIGILLLDELSSLARQSLLFVPPALLVRLIRLRRAGVRAA